MITDLLLLFKRLSHDGQRVGRSKSQGPLSHGNKHMQWARMYSLYTYTHTAFAEMLCVGEPSLRTQTESFKGSPGLAGCMSPSAPVKSVFIRPSRYKIRVRPLVVSRRAAGWWKGLSLNPAPTPVSEAGHPLVVQGRHYWLKAGT